MWQDLRRQPQWSLRVMLGSSGCTFASVLMSGPNRALGGPALYFVVLLGSGAMLVLSIMLMLLRGRDRHGDR